MASIAPEIIELEEQETLAVRGDVPVTGLQEFFGQAFTAVWSAAHECGVDIVGPPFAFYPSMPTDTVVVEAGAPVSAPVETSGEVHRLVLPGGRAMVAVHVGPYDTLEKTYAELQDWMDEHAIAPAAGMWECYLSDPAVDPDAATCETQIVWPITEA